jgi:hypothetical protein
MQLNFELQNYYDHSWNIEFQGKLNHAHWYVYEITHDEIVLCHDTDPDVITFCKVLGDSIDVWIDGDRTECMLDVKKHFEEDAVYVTLYLNPEEEALYNGPYDSVTNAEIV